MRSPKEYIWHKIGRLILLTLGLFTMHHINSQDIPRLDPDEIQLARIISGNIYEGAALSRYINGSIELYKAYGFEKLSKQEVELEGEKYTVLVYQMADPESAYGIYSIFRKKCDTIPRLTRSDCVTASVYFAQRNKYYYSVINQFDSKKAGQESIDLARTLAGKIHPDSIPWPGIFDYDLFIGYQNSLKLIHGNIALQQVLPAWSSFFESIGNYKAWYLSVETEKSGSFELSLISFENSSDRNHFIKNSSLKLQKIGSLNPGNARLGWNIGEFDILFVDASKFKDSLSPYASAFYQYINKQTGKKK